MFGYNKAVSRLLCQGFLSRGTLAAVVVENLLFDSSSSSDLKNDVVIALLI